MIFQKGRSGFWAVILALSAWGAGFHGAAAQASPSGNDAPGFFAIKSHHGLILVSNEYDSHYLVRFKGNTVDHTTLGEGDDQFDVLILDGLYTQFTNAGISQFYTGDLSKLTDEDILAKHFEWESAYQAKRLGSPLKMGMKIFIKGVNGKTYYFWEYDMPHPPKDGIKRNLMLVTRVKNCLMVLNGMLLDMGQEEAMMKKLVATANTMAVYPKPITVDQVRALVAKE